MTTVGRLFQHQLGDGPYRAVFWLGRDHLGTGTLSTVLLLGPESDRTKLHPLPLPSRVLVLCRSCGGPNPPLFPRSMERHREGGSPKPGNGHRQQPLVVWPATPHRHSVCPTLCRGDRWIWELTPGVPWRTWTLRHSTGGAYAPSPRVGGHPDSSIHPSIPCLPTHRACPTCPT